MWRFALLALLSLGPAVASAQSADRERLDDVISADQSALKDARGQIDQINAALRDDETHAGEIRIRLAGGSRDLIRIHRDLDEANNDLSVAQREFKPIKDRHDSAQDRLDQARQQARERLEDNLEYRKAADAVRTASDELKSMEEASARSLSRTSSYRSLQGAVNAAEARIDYFHHAGPAFFRDEDDARDRLRTAISRRDAAKEQFLAGDPAVLQARQKLQNEQSELASLQSKVESKLGSVPEVAEAQRALDDQQNPFASASARFDSARQRVATIRNALRATEDGMAADRQTLQAIGDDIAEGRADLAVINADIDRIASDLTAALAAADLARSQDALAADEYANSIGPTSWRVPGGSIPIPSVPPPTSTPEVAGSPVVVGAPIFLQSGYWGAGAWYPRNRGLRGRRGEGSFGQVPRFDATTSNIPTGEWVGHPQSWQGTGSATPHGRFAGSGVSVSPSIGQSSSEVPAGAFPQIIGTGRAAPAPSMTFTGPQQNPTAGAYPRFGVPAPQIGNSAQAAGSQGGSDGATAAHARPAGHR